MVHVSERSQPRRRKFFRGFRQEVAVGKAFEPKEKVYVVIAPDRSLFSGVIPQLKLREELYEDLWRESDDRHAMTLIDRIADIESAWGHQGITVRRKILWF